MNFTGDDLNLVLAALKEAASTVPTGRPVGIWTHGCLRDLIERIEQWQKDEAEEEAER